MPRYSETTLMGWYNEYEEAHRQQSNIIDNDLDWVLFQEIMPKFRTLDSIVVAAAHWFDNELGRCRDTGTPFDNLAIEARGNILPVALRQTSSILCPVASLPPYLRQLRLGQVDYTFLSHPFFQKLVDICGNLRSFEMVVGTGRDRGIDDEHGTNECRTSVKRGHLRRLLASMAHLEILSIGFFVNYVPNPYPATLGDIVAGMRWEHLKTLKLCLVETTRTELADLMQRHSATLRSVSLSDIRLDNSSWMVLLPQLQVLARDMKLEDFLIAGKIYGEAEDGSLEQEFFYLGDPETCEDDLPQAERIKRYLLTGEGPNPLETPIVLSPEMTTDLASS